MHGMHASRRSTPHLLSLIALLLTVCPPVLSDLANLAGSLADGAGTLPDVVTVAVEPAFITLTEDADDSEGNGILAPPIQSAMFEALIVAPMPDWGIAIAIDGACGPDGTPPSLPYSIVRPGVIDQPLELTSPRVLALGWEEGSEPGTEWVVPVRVLIEPTWQDRPGLYSGALRAIPFYAEDPGLHPGMPLTTWTPLGAEFVCELHCEVRELTLIQTSPGPFSVQTSSGTGRFEIHPDLEIQVASNAAQWSVRLEGSSFASAIHELPANLLHWGRVLPGGGVEEWVALSESSLLLSGSDDRGVFAETFRLALETTMAHPAGDYSAEFHVVGSGGSYTNDDWEYTQGPRAERR